MALVELSKVLDAVDAEPEFPGAPKSVFLTQLLSVMEGQDIEGKLELLRIVVRETKAGIRTRVQSLPHRGGA